MNSEQLQNFVVNKADDMKALDIVSIDVRDKSSITDFMVIATGTSKRHLAAITDNVAQKAMALEIPILGMEGQNEAEWIVLDLGDVMLHVMQEEARKLYQLEKLWSDL